MESAEHIELVGIIRTYVENKVGEKNAELITIDSSGESTGVRVVDNYIPDVFFRNQNTMIIGEAKTSQDFDRPHSRRQYDAYLKELCMFSGDKTLVVCVPWQTYFTAKNYFKLIKRKQELDVCIVVMNNNSRCDMI